MFNSIRLKLTLWYICVVALIIAIFSVVGYTLFVRVLRDETNKNIAEMATNFISAIKEEQKDEAKKKPSESIIANTTNEFNFRDYQFAVFSNDGKLISKTTYAELPSNLLSVDSNISAEIILANEPHRVRADTFRIHDKSYKLFVFFPLTDQIAIESRIQRIFLIAAPLILLFAGLGGYFLARESLKPIAKMGEQAKRISAANLHQRLPVANENDEIGNLAVVFNQLLDRLDQEFERQRRFMADASHELRTPLAIIRGESEVALSSDSRTSNSYQESLRIVNDEGKRLTNIVEDLFTLARADSGEIKAVHREIYVDEIVSDCVRSVRTLAEQRKISLKYDGEEMKVQGDEALLRRLFLNLLDNAVKYNYNNGSIRVSASGYVITVANTGPEIPTDQRSMIFERFYRVDKTRSRQMDTTTSGAGLGLSISKLIAEMHGAKLEFNRSKEGENIFSVIFPR